MADVDIMDLFDKDFIQPEESLEARPSGIQDYKPARTYQASSRTKPGESSLKRSLEESKPVKETSSSDIDEKLVWVGAIFVFFGVFAFLLGYWLGNIKEKEISEVQKTKQSLLAEKVEEQKTEIALKQQALPVQQAQDMVPQASVSPTSPSTQEVPVIPSLTETPTQKPSSTSSSVKTQTQPKSETKSTPKSPSSSPSQSPVSSPSHAGVSGSGAFTIQVSAHTSLEKAQAIENQLRQGGFSPYIVETTINETTYYRVRVGSYGSKSEAESALARLKQNPVGKDAYVLSLK
ncbi:MAG: SPOR domain-containing protein [Brevinematales bacterium]|nr:SPOR domain-containing protein [Brevinematales bacterium]